MNDELQKALAAILNKTTSAAEAGIGFLQGQIPEVIHQLLVWKAVESGLIFTLCLIGACVLTWVGCRLAKDDDFGFNPLAMFPFFGVVLCVLGVITNFDWLQILLAPKVYLIEYAAHLAK
jgi:hypothetical protein